MSDALRQSLDALIAGQPDAIDAIAVAWSACADDPGAVGELVRDLGVGAWDGLDGEEATAFAHTLCAVLADGDGAWSSATREALAAEAAPEVADGVFSALGLDDGWRTGAVADAVAQEAGRVEVAAAHDPAAIDVASAVRAEAGAVSLANVVMARLVGADSSGAAHVGADELPEDARLSAMLDHALAPAERAAVVRRLSEDAGARATMAAWADLGRQLRAAVRDAAGPRQDLWTSVAPAIGLADPEAVPGWDEDVLGGAVASEAGTVDVVASVMAVVTREASRDLGTVPDLPESATTVDGWRVGVALLVAATLMLLVGPRLVAMMADEGAGAPASGGFTEQTVQFATADEISVDRIAAGEDASVFVEVPDDKDAPLIIWVDDGGTL